MDTDEKAIILPNSEEIVRRLTAVYDDDLAQRLYDRVSRAGGKEKFAGGVVMLFTHAIYEVTSGYPPKMSGILHMYVPRWIDALVDDKEVAEAAKAFHQQAVQNARRKG